MLLPKSQNQAQSFLLIVNFFKKNNFCFEVDENETTISTKFSGDNGNWHTHIHIDTDMEILFIISFCPLNAKDSKKLLVAELLTRINNNLLLGSFKLNFEDGLICFTNTQLLKQSPLNLINFETLFDTNLNTLDKHIPAISAVNSGYIEPCLAAQ